MKTTKGELKLILKECIKELIAEGAFPNIGMPATQGRQQPSFGGYPPPAVNQQTANIAQMMARNASGGDAQQAKILESVSWMLLWHPIQMLPLHNSNKL